MLMSPDQNSWVGSSLKSARSQMASPAVPIAWGYFGLLMDPYKSVLN